MLVISSLYLWYLEDWNDKAGLIEHLKAYAEGDLATTLQDFKGEIADAYDWSLNDAEY